MDSRSLAAYAIIAVLALLLAVVLWRWTSGGTRRRGFSPLEQFRRGPRKD